MNDAIAIVVVSFNTRDLLRNCLEHLATATQGIQTHVVVVDNASADGSADMVRGSLDRVHLIVNERNRGFGPACNQGIAATTAPYVLLLNSDCSLRSGALALLAGYLDDNPRVAAVGPRLLNEDGSLQLSARRFPTPRRVLVEILGMSNRFEGQHVSGSAYDQAGPMDYVSGACLLLRRTALDDVGVFDEAYFFYAEEMDLAYRLWQRAWQVHYMPEAQAIHLGGRSTHQAQGGQLWYEPYYAGQARFFHKHYGTAALLAWQALMLLMHGWGLIRGARRSLVLSRLTLAATWRELFRGAPVVR